MVLLLPDGVTAAVSSHGNLEADILNIETRNEAIHAANEAFLATSSQPLQAHVKEIQVLQAECALVDLSREPNDDIYLSSEDATTCCIILFRCLQSRRLFIAHLDESTTGDSAALRRALTGMQQPELFIAGGYLDASGTGMKVLSAFLGLLHFGFEQEVVLRLLCCGTANTNVQGLPCTQRLCYETATQRCCCAPAVMEVPIVIARSGMAWARAFSADRRQQAHLIDVYDTLSCRLVFQAVGYHFPRYMHWHLHELLSYDDATLLQKCSTSPDAETPNFTRRVRHALMWSIEHWENNMICLPRTVFELVEGCGWQLVHARGAAPAYQYGLVGGGASRGGKQLAEAL